VIKLGFASSSVSVVTKSNHQLQPPSPQTTGYYSGVIPTVVIKEGSTSQEEEEEVISFNQDFLELKQKDEHQNNRNIIELDDQLHSPFLTKRKKQILKKRYRKNCKHCPHCHHCLHCHSNMVAVVTPTNISEASPSCSSSVTHSSSSLGTITSSCPQCHKKLLPLKGGSCSSGPQNSNNLSRPHLHHRQLSNHALNLHPLAHPSSLPSIIPLKQDQELLTGKRKTRDFFWGLFFVLFVGSLVCFLLWSLLIYVLDMQRLLISLSLSC